MKERNKTQHMNLQKFYTEEKFGGLIDLHSMADYAMHGSSTHLVNTKDRAQLQIEKGCERLRQCQLSHLRHQ